MSVWSAWEAVVAKPRVGPPSGADARATQEDIRRLWDRAVAAWPTLTVSPESFAERLYTAIAALPAGADVDSLAIEDLTLAAQCLAGDTKAIALLDPRIHQAVARAATNARVEPRELAQLTRVHLLIGAGRRGPRLAHYSGRAQLGSWLRIVTARLALNAARAERARPQPAGEFCDPIARSTPELDALHAERQARFTEAFHAAYRQRTAAERQLLKGYFVKEQTLAALGEELGVHTSTAARRLAAAREALLEGFHAQLRALAGTDETRAEALLGILRSRLQLSEGALLRTTEPEPPI